MSEKLQKVLARAGHGSRRELEALIRAGRVSVNGKVAVLGERLEDDNAVVRIDGHVVSVKAQEEVICRVLAYYKPEGELCTRHDPEVAVRYLTVCRKFVVHAGFLLAVWTPTRQVCCCLPPMVNWLTV